MQLKSETRPPHAVLGRLPTTEVFRNIERCVPTCQPARLLCHASAPLPAACGHWGLGTRRAVSPPRSGEPL